jgi:hypothetical protein
MKKKYNSKPRKNQEQADPFVWHPQTKTKSGNHCTYRMGMTEFYWKSPTKGGKVVKLTYMLDSAVCLQAVGCKLTVFTVLVLLHLQVHYEKGLDWNRWNHTAKKRILLDDENNLQCLVPSSPTMSAYYVSKRTVSSAGTLVSSLCSTATASLYIATLAITTKEEEDGAAWEEPEAIFQQDLEISAPSQVEKGSAHLETVVTTTIIPQNTINNQAAGHSTVQGVDRIAAHATEKEVGQSNLQCTGKSKGRKSPMTNLCFVFRLTMYGRKQIWKRTET